MRPILLLLVPIAVSSLAAAPARAVSGTWTREAAMPTARSAHAVAATPDAIYALGGTGGGGTPVLDLDRFDGRVWETVGTIPGEGLNAPAAAAVDGAVYLIGGFGTTTNRPTTAVHRYDTRTKTWSVVAPLPAPRGGHAAVVLDGRIHVIGGGNSQSTIDAHSEYDPRTDTWRERAKLPRSMGSPAAAVHGGRLYSIGGRSGPGDFGDVHVYDPRTDMWSPGPSIGPRGTGGAAALNGAIYYFGGESQAQRAVLADVLRLVPGASGWTADTPLPVPRSYGRAVTFNGAIYVIGGSTEFGASHASKGSAFVERFVPAK